MIEIIPYNGKMDAPLTKDQIDTAKSGFIEFHGSLDNCECVGCKYQERNECIFQFDPYNTKGDYCLAEK